jgi:hypothetical protein
MKPEIVTDAAGGFLNFLIQSIAAMANNPSNKKFFLPLFLAGLKIDGDKSLVPYQTEMNMGPVPSIEGQVSGTVCNSGWAPLNNYDGAYASTVPILNITSVSINGLNNAVISSYKIYPANEQLQYAIVFDAKMNAYPNYGQLTFDPAKFYFDVTCESNDKAHQEDINATGSFTASVGEAVLTVVLLITLNDDLTSTVTVPAAFNTPQGTAIPGIGITFGTGDGLVISDITLDGTNPMNQFNEIAINQAFSDQDTLDKIQAMFNTNINTDDVRATVGQAIQGQFNSLINDLK